MIKRKHSGKAPCLFAFEHTCIQMHLRDTNTRPQFPTKILGKGKSEKIPWREGGLFWVF